MFSMRVAAVHICNASALAHSKGHLSLKELQGCPEWKIDGIREKDKQGFGGGEFMRNTWVKYCQWILALTVRHEGESCLEMMILAD